MRTILRLISLIAVILVALVCFKSPDTLKDIFGINSEKTTIANVPYYCNISSLSKNSGYRSQYLKDGNLYWYTSWGNATGIGESENNKGFLLGWNDKEPQYGSYSSNRDSVISKIEIGDGVNYSYLVQDFDFGINHNVAFRFSPIDDLSQNESSAIIFIRSIDKGKNWSVVDTIDYTELMKNAELSFIDKYETLQAKQFVRYGLVIKSNSIMRVRVDDFIVKRIGVSV